MLCMKLIFNNEFYRSLLPLKKSIVPEESGVNTGSIAQPRLAKKPAGFMDDFSFINADAIYKQCAKNKMLLDFFASEGFKESFDTQGMVVEYNKEFSNDPLPVMYTILHEDKSDPMAKLLMPAASKRMLCYLLGSGPELNDSIKSSFWHKNLPEEILKHKILTLSRLFVGAHEETLTDNTDKVKNYFTETLRATEEQFQKINEIINSKTDPFKYDLKALEIYEILKPDETQQLKAFLKNFHNENYVSDEAKLKLLLENFEYILTEAIDNEDSILNDNSKFNFLQLLIYLANNSSLKSREESMKAAFNDYEMNKKKLEEQEEIKKHNLLKEKLDFNSVDSSGILSGLFGSWMETLNNKDTEAFDALIKEKLQESSFENVDSYLSFLGENRDEIINRFEKQQISYELAVYFLVFAGDKLIDIRDN